MHQKFNIPKVFTIFVCLWIVVSLGLYIVIDYILGDERFVSSFIHDSDMNTKLNFLMSVDNDNAAIANTFVTNPLSHLYLAKEQRLNFYNLPKRMYNAQYSELTSANRDTSYPLSPDFTFHVEYGPNFVVLYEDFQPGCIYRLYLFPVMPSDITSLHRLSAADLRQSYLNFHIDGADFKYSLEQLLDGNKFPFLHPMSPTHAKPASGVGAYSPLCYQDYIKITYYHDGNFPTNLFEETVNCTLNDFLCPVHIYSAVSRHNYPIGTKIRSYQQLHDDPIELKKYTKFLTEAVHILRNPELNGPNKHTQCQLSCRRMCAGCKKTLFQSKTSGVISSFVMRVYKKVGVGHAFMLPNWNHLKLTMWFDEEKNAVPQIDRAPLGQVFGVTGSLNDFMGAALGHRERYCSYDNMDTDDDGHNNFPILDTTGYIYFPMPYWHSVSIILENTRSIDANLYACFQLITVPNYYNKNITGYFHAANTFYGADVSGWRSLLQLNSMWGHIVGVFININNLRAKRDCPLNERFATLQSDPVIFTDGRNEPIVMGTGLEDYFSYAHGFALAENTTYSFVGNYHSSPRRPEPLTFHSYRLHVLDPIPFHDSIRFIMAGTNREDFQKSIRRLSEEEFDRRLLQEETTLSHMILYYGKKHDYLNLSAFDAVLFGSAFSESSHGFKELSDQQSSFFHVVNKHYLGQHLHSEVFNRSGRHFTSKHRFKFSLKAMFLSSGMRDHNLQGFILRREYYSPPPIWGQRAKVWINEKFQGVWNTPMGSVNSGYALREDDFNISPLICVQTKTSDQLMHFEIQPETDWMDIKYTLIVIEY